MTESYRSTVGAYQSRGWVTLDGEVGLRQLEQLSAKLIARPEARLRVVRMGQTDLQFLTDLPPLRELEVVLSDVRSLAAIAHHGGSLRSLHLVAGAGVRSVQALSELSELQNLYLRAPSGARITDLSSALATARRLEHLVLHGMSLPDLTPLVGMRALRGLALKLGRAPDLAAVTELPSLRFFEAFQVRGLDDLRPVAQSRTLEVLHLEGLRTAEIPDLGSADALAHVRVDNLPLANGLRTISRAPNLRQVLITRRQFELEDIEVFRGHPNLEAVSVPVRGRATSSEVLGLGTVHEAPFVAFGAGVMGLPPRGWNGIYVEESVLEN